MNLGCIRASDRDVDGLLEVNLCSAESNRTPKDNMYR